MKQPEEPKRRATTDPKARNQTHVQLVKIAVANQRNMEKKLTVNHFSNATTQVLSMGGLRKDPRY